MNDRLDSWKEIAAYLKRDVTTVRRWEKRQGLPVHRHLHERRDSVYASAAEIDGWWAARRHNLTDNGAFEGVPLTGGNGSSESAVVPETPWHLPRAPLAWALAATFLVTTLVLTALLVVGDRPNPADEALALRFAILPPDETSFGSATLSPDGRRLAFTAEPVSSSGARTLLWVRPLDALAARSMPDTEDATFPFWSPAGDALGFFAGGKLWVVELSGGPPRAVSDAPDGRGGTWNREGIIVFAPGPDGALLRVAATGGAATAVTTVVPPDQRGHVWPEFLPDGDHFLYLADGIGNVPEQHNIFVGALDSPEPTLLVPLASSNAAYGANGYVFFARDRQLVAQPFDTSRLAVTGEPITLVERIQQQVHHKMDVTVSANGVLAYRTMQSPATRLVWRDRAQAQSPLVSTPAEYTEPSLSPDESRVAIGLFDPRPSKRFGFGVAGVRSDIWILDRSTGAGSQFTFDPAADWGPVWSPDGRSIVFSSNRRDNNLELYQKDASGDATEQLLLAANGSNPVAQSWSPDGKFLVYSAFDPKTSMDLWLLPMAGDRTPVPLLRTEFREDQGQISPDGRWLAYTSNESGRSEVFVQGFPEPAVRRQVSISGGGDARWRADGKELFYIADDRRLMAVAVNTGAALEHGPAVPLFDTGVPSGWYSARNLYVVSRDGQFLFMTPIEDDRSTPFTIVVNGLPH